MRFYCNCGRSYKYPEGLHRHRKECGKEKKYKCPHCEHRSHRTDNLKKHMLRNNDFDSPCNRKRCRRTTLQRNSAIPYLDSSRLLEHDFYNFSLVDHFYMDGVWFVCKTCNKRYKHRTSVWRHIKWECNKKPQFACYVCGKRVTQKTSLKAHLENIHVASRYHAYHLLDGLDGPYPCHVCQKKYKYKTSLNKHLKYECNKDPSFVCPICAKKFYQKIHLKKHMLSVPQVGWQQHWRHECGRLPKYTCHICNQGFTHQGHLRYHLSTTHNLNFDNFDFSVRTRPKY
ncbi:zinc finger protein 394-like [Cylas formicarius]|uniref:zinc finger protein 394-like n=1 Tax=Cylas formicarius TaxID=197179 RepID=UPI0029584B9C|nr:zinc finger protein 394-like [Cylas formicarius]